MYNSNDAVRISKIALTHLNEFSNYYNKEYRLKIFEQFLKEKANNE